MAQHLNLLEKTVWTFKNVKNDELTSENLEIILNFYDGSKYEMNINRYYSEMYLLLLFI